MRCGNFLLPELSLCKEGEVVGIDAVDTDREGGERKREMVGWDNGTEADMERVLSVFVPWSTDDAGRALGHLGECMEDLCDGCRSSRDKEF